MTLSYTVIQPIVNLNILVQLIKTHDMKGANIDDSWIAPCLWLTISLGTYNEKPTEFLIHFLWKHCED